MSKHLITFVEYLRKLNQKKDFDDLTKKKSTIYLNKSPNSDTEKIHFSSKYIFFI